jgi:phosphoserine phosphatase
MGTQPSKLAVRFAARWPLAAGLEGAPPASAWKPVPGDARFATAEAQVPSLAEALASVRPSFSRGATVGVVPSAPVRAIFFDMDATAVAEESIVELAARAGRGREVQEITERAMRGELDFETALRQRVQMLKGAPTSIVDDVAAALTPSPGLAGCVKAAKALGVPCFLVSGGFVELAAGLARSVGFAAYEANRLGASGGVLTGTLAGPVVDAAAKRRFLLARCAELAISPASVAAVGDGANDLLMMGAAGIAVGFKPKPVLWPHLHAQDAAGDHGFLGPLLLGKAAN